jgi:hypothetical protein
MNDSNQQFPVLELIEGLVLKVSELLMDQGPDPVEGSLAERQMAANPWASDVRNAFSQATLLIEISSDHILSFQRAITEPVLPTAAWASVRGVLETSALSAWLLDPNIDPSQRAARSYALRYEGLIEQKKFARSMNDDTALHLSMERIEQVVQRAISQGHGPLFNKLGKQSGLGTRLPPTTELVASELDAEAEYRLLSAVLHGHHWATQQLSFARAVDREPFVLEKSISPIAILYLAQRAVLYFAASLRRKFDVYGWERSTLDSHLHSVLSTLQDLFAGLKELEEPKLA